MRDAPSLFNFSPCSFPVIQRQKMTALKIKEIWIIHWFGPTYPAGGTYTDKVPLCLVTFKYHHIVPLRLELSYDFHATYDARVQFSIKFELCFLTKLVVFDVLQNGILLLDYVGFCINFSGGILEHA
jgi:hypothetical protein